MIKFRMEGNFFDIPHVIEMCNPRLELDSEEFLQLCDDLEAIALAVPNGEYIRYNDLFDKMQVFRSGEKLKRKPVYEGEKLVGFGKAKKSKDPSHLITFDGERYTVPGFAELLGYSPSRLLYYLNTFEYCMIGEKKVVFSGTTGSRFLNLFDGEYYVEKLTSGEVCKILGIEKPRVVVRNSFNKKTWVGSQGDWTTAFTKNICVFWDGKKVHFTKRKNLPFDYLPGGYTEKGSKFVCGAKTFLTLKPDYEPKKMKAQEYLKLKEIL